MAPKHKLGRFATAPLLAACIALLGLAGCASVDVQTPAESAHNEIVVEAQALARNHAALSGQARADNATRIDGLLARLDDATLTRAAAGLAVGDALYNFAGRALITRGLPLPRPFDRGEWNFDAAGDRRPTAMAIARR